MVQSTELKKPLVPTNILSNIIVRIRVLATLVIVAFHCTCPFYAWQYGGGNFDMESVGHVYDRIFLHVFCNTMLPTFFMISGMLFYTYKKRYKDRRSTFWKKFDRLLIPYVMVFTLVSSLDLPNIGVAEAVGHLWFVRELFIIFFFSLLMFRVKEIWLLLIGCIAYAFYILGGKMNLSYPPVLEHLLMFYIFFIGGHYVARYMHILRRRGVALLLCALWLIAVIFDVQTAYTSLFNLMIVAIMPSSEITNKLVLSINRNSFGIYLIHHVIIFALFPISFVRGLYDAHFVIAPLAMFVTALSGAWMISEGLKRVGFRYF